MMPSKLKQFLKIFIAISSAFLTQQAASMQCTCANELFATGSCSNPSNGVCDIPGGICYMGYNVTAGTIAKGCIPTDGLPNINNNNPIGLDEICFKMNRPLSREFMYRCCFSDFCNGIPDPTTTTPLPSTTTTLTWEISSNDELIPNGLEEILADAIAPSAYHLFAPEAPVVDDNDEIPVGDDSIEPYDVITTGSFFYIFLAFLSLMIILIIIIVAMYFVRGRKTRKNNNNEAMENILIVPSSKEGSKCFTHLPILGEAV